MLTFTPAISLDHFQFALIHGPNIPGSYAILLFIASDLASIPSHIHYWVLFLLWLHLIFSEVISPLSLVAYWAPTDLGVSLSVSYYFAFSYCSWVSQGKNTEVVCHSFLQWTTSTIYVETAKHPSLLFQRKLHQETEPIKCGLLRLPRERMCRERGGLGTQHCEALLVKGCPVLIQSFSGPKKP